MTWSHAAAAVGLIGGTLAAGDMVLTSSMVSNAVKSVAAESGMVTMPDRPQPAPASLALSSAQGVTAHVMVEEARVPRARAIAGKA
jgi:hypothetical protein